MITLNELLKLKLTDHLLLYQLRQPGAKEAFLAESQEAILRKVDMLIRLAHIHPEIEDFCKHPSLDEHWNLVYDEFVLIFQEEENSQELFVHSHPSIPSFDLMRGMYFFYHSQQIRQEFPEQTGKEVSLLKQAMRYTSIHAMERYHELLYLEIEKNPAKAPELFKEIIENCKTMLEFYGSFAYCMLTEAYGRYACYLSTNKDLQGAQSQYKSALTAFAYAEQFLRVSEYSIHNASFGKGLKVSNSLGLGSIPQIKQFIQDKMSPLLFKTSPADSRLSPEIEKEMVLSSVLGGG